jgi:hypothetical protein
METFRMFTSQLAINGNVSRAQISRTFGVPLVTVKALREALPPGGVHAFSHRKSGKAAYRVGHKLTAEVRQHAQKAA